MNNAVLIFYDIILAGAILGIAKLIDMVSDSKWTWYSILFPMLMRKKKSVCSPAVSLESGKQEKTPKRTLETEVSSDTQFIPFKWGLFFNGFMLIIMAGLLWDRKTVTAEDLISLLMALIAFNYVIYIFLKGVVFIINFMVQQNKWLWALLIAVPVMIIAFGSSIQQDGNYVLKVILIAESMLLLILTVILLVHFLYKLFISEFSENQDSQYAIGTSLIQKFGSILSILFIELMNFTAWNYFFANRFPDYLTGKEGQVKSFVDVLYYTVTSFATVGYGDITPGNELSRISACVMSIIGFFTSVCLITVVLAHSKKESAR